MKYIYLTIFLSLLIATTISESTSFLKKPSNITVNVTNSTVTISTVDGEPKSYQGFCLMKMKSNFYDLRPFNMIKPWKVTDITGKTVNFNFCSNVDTSCRADESLMADSKTCKKFAGRSDQEKSWTLGSDINKNDVITVVLPKGDSCGNGKYFETTLELTCDRRVNVPVITNDKTFNPLNCQNLIKMRSKQGINFKIYNINILFLILHTIIIYYYDNFLIFFSMQQRKIQCLVESIRYPQRRISSNINNYWVILYDLWSLLLANELCRDKLRNSWINLLLFLISIRQS